MLVSVLLLAGTLLARPLLLHQIRRRLTEQVGPVRSLAVTGSTLDLLQGNPTTLAVAFSTATVDGQSGSDPAGASKVAHIDRVTFSAQTLHTGTLTFQNIDGTITKGALNFTGTVPAQPLSVAGHQIPVAPSARHGSLALTVAALPISFILTAVSGQPDIEITGSGLLAGHPIPLARLSGTSSRADSPPNVQIDSIHAHSHKGHVVVNITGQLGV